MAHEQFFRNVAEHLAREPRIEGLFVAGSHGQGTADRFSDIDLVALADGQHHDRIAGLWRSTLDGLHPVVFWNERRGGGILINAITDRWLRCDLVIVASRDFGRRSRASVKPLIDRAGLYDRLPETLPPATPDPKRIGSLVNEFIRVLGLMTVGLGRQEYVLSVKGTALLRDLLTDLMLEECPLPDRGGILHPSRLLRPDQMALLAALPYPGPERDALIAAHVAIAEAFFPIARALTERTGIAWPERFEAATRRHLEQELGVRFG